MYDELVRRLREDVPKAISNFDYDFVEDWIKVKRSIKEAADAIEELNGFVQEAERDRDEYRERLDKSNDAIEELMRRCKQFQYMPLPAWIPVTERLPETPGEYMKSDKLIDPRPLHLRMCCGEMPIVHQFSGLGCYTIECRINGHIHNSGLCDTLKQACKEWNSKEPKEE